MIRFEGVGKSYGTVRAVESLDMEVRERELCVLVGPSGSGKSTILRMVNRLVEPSEGRVFVEGRDLRGRDPEELRRRIGYVIQGVGLFPHLTVSANVAVVPSLLKWRKSRIAERVTEMLGLVGLDPARYGARYPAELSGGEAQRVGVARALASDPPILLMDEPFSAVDPLGRARLQKEFLSIQRRLRKTVVFVTHDVDEAIRLADRLAVVKSGRLVQFDAPEELLERPADAFVAGFVGSDRALKRLSRFPVREWMRSAQALDRGGDLAAELCGSDGYRWVTGEGGRLVGCIDRSLAACGDDPESVLAQQHVEEMAIDREASLKEALSAMLGSSSRNLAVVDECFRLVGEIGLSDIERAAEAGARQP
ncbi:MAG TPA: ABC transporter ATP-binding protein [Rectinemataceae bacterium]|nr:ABC transporter ATP-binding protein [Rectinemataceae bacterium]